MFTYTAALSIILVKSYDVLYGYYLSDMFSYKFMETKPFFKLDCKFLIVRKSVLVV